MCGRMVSTTPSAALAGIFGAEVAVIGDDHADYNLAPTAPVRAVTDDGSRRCLSTFRWGLVPRSAKTVTAGPLMINARAETLTTKPVFARLLTRHRCIVPADGFYEWTAADDGSRQPWYLHPADGPVFAFAGLCDTWVDPANGQVIPNLTVITTTASPDVAPVHDRMPVILPGPARHRWLDPAVKDVAALMALLVPAAPGAIARYRVSSAANSVRNNSPELLDALAD